jgi:hypothetical protein
LPVGQGDEDDAHPAKRKLRATRRSLCSLFKADKKEVPFAIVIVLGLKGRFELLQSMRKIEFIFPYAVNGFPKLLWGLPKDLFCYRVSGVEMLFSIHWSRDF